MKTSLRVEIKETVYDDRLILKSQEVVLGDMTLIMGLSGSGKTTLLKQIQSQINCGYVTQDPDNQLVCDKVWHELAFGLENIGTHSKLIRSRVAEVATYLGIDDIINKDVTELSGGQKQKVCLASILCMAPDLILLDEPTSMLDPIASKEFWSVVNRLSKDRGVRFVIVEHDPYVIDMCDTTFILSNGVLRRGAKHRNTVVLSGNKRREVYKVIKYIRKSYGDKLILNIPYLEIHEGINFIIGPNGSGKTTLLRTLTGGFGEKKVVQWSTMMPQDVKMMFSHDTVEEELNGKVPEELKHLRKSNPYDLSGGEQHILGVYMTLQRMSGLYCFDEPTKGMDHETKHKIMSIIVSSGKNVLIVSHDLDIVAQYANNVIFLFNTEIASEGTPRSVFEHNLFYKPEGIRWI